MVISVVTWKWGPPIGYRSHFTAEHVNTLRRMVARHYPHPHRFLCVTDDAHGLDREVEAIPMWPDHAALLSPHGALSPSCYRRLKAFAAEIEPILGARFVSIDLDTVIVGDLSPVWNRREDFVIWGETDPRSFYNGSMFLMNAGARRQVWDTFDPVKSPKTAHAAGRFGSDQGWISYCLGDGEARWTTAEGVYSFRKHIYPRGGLPAGARIVMFHGHIDPWHPEAQRLSWVREHYQ